MQLVKFNPFFPVFDEDENWPQFRVNDNLDVYETENEIVVRAAVPGMAADKVEVTFENGVLRISAKSEETEEEKEKKKVVYKSQRVNYFDYTTTLPRAVDGDKIDASVKNGIVTNTAPIAPAAKPKKIAVKTK